MTPSPPIQTIIQLKRGLFEYSLRGRGPSRFWTLERMLQLASDFTGLSYSRSDVSRAISDLDALLKKDLN